MSLTKLAAAGSRTATCSLTAAAQHLSRGRTLAARTLDREARAAISQLRKALQSLISPRCAGPRCQCF